MTALRQGLLKGRAVVLAGGTDPAVAAALRDLGARVEGLDVGQLATEDGVAAWAAAAAGSNWARIRSYGRLSPRSRG